MELPVFFLVVTILQPGLILCAVHAAKTDNIGEAELLHRIKEFDSREQEQEVGQQVSNDRMFEVLLKLDDVLAENKQLRHDINKLNDRVTDIENENEKLRNELNDIKADNPIKVEGDNLDQEKDKDSDVRQVSSDENTGTDGKHEYSMRYAREGSDNNRIRRAENEVDVAFYAVMTDHTMHLGVNQNVPFNRVITNVGNAYNVHSGDFRAPVSGTYLFHVSLVAYDTQYAHYYISKNSAQVGRLILNGTPHTSMSQMAVLQLNAGDDVAIRNENADEALQGYHYCSFSGFLLKQYFS